MAERGIGKETIDMTPTQTTAAPALDTRVLAIVAAALGLLLLILGALGLGANEAKAAEGIKSFTMSTTSTQAGGHPDVIFTYRFKNRSEPPQADCHCDDPRLIITDSPAGFIANPHAYPKCQLDAFALGECAEESQVGVFTSFGSLSEAAPLYNMVTRPDQAGQIGFIIPFLNVPVFFDIAARTESDYGLTTTAGPIYHVLPLSEIEVHLWGVPSDPSHDFLRAQTPIGPFPILGSPSNAPRRPYLQNPTTCGVPLSAGVRMEYYTGNSFSAETPYPAMTGCDNLGFNPSLTAQPTTSQADTAVGLDVNLQVPQTQSPTTPTPSQIKSVSVKLPPGYTLNPNAADGKVACSVFDSAIGRTRGPASCPEFSKIGTSRIDSSALPGPVYGAIYIGEPLPGSRYRMVLTGEGHGTNIKLAGTIVPDPQTGQLTVGFPELPQSPLTEFDMHIFGSERGSLATPSQCGTYPVESTFVPWNSSAPVQTSRSFFSITSGPNGEPCPSTPRDHQPRFEAGTENATAGMFSPFNLRVARDDGDQLLSRLDIRTPRGFAASLRGIPYCPQSAIDQLTASGYLGVTEQAKPACSAASEIGTVVAGAGAGSQPLHVGGKAYLAGPYKGAPLSMVIVVPAVSGPYDLGVVAIRAATFVDPDTAVISVFSDPLPSILEGTPLRTRLLAVNLNRPNFTYNPTNCDPFAVTTSIFGDEGGVAARSERFQAANCADLPYGPPLTISLKGSLKRRGHPAIHAELHPSAGEANSRNVSVLLPKGSLLDNTHINTICTRVAYAADACPAGAVYGTATATTPVLDEPLSGPIYLRSSSNKLPDLVIDLDGQLDVEASAKVDSVKGRMRISFTQLPDVPVSSFVLDMQGGEKGLLESSENLCKTAKRVTVRMEGQNGARLTKRPKLITKCNATPRKKRTAHRAGTGR
jgi:hypothetical protein